MAAIGLKYPVFAILAENGSTPSYSNGAVLGKAITLNSTIETANAPLYADDGISEVDNSFLSGTISVGFDHLIDAVKIALLGYAEGAEVDAAISSKELSAGSGSVVPFVGFGFYGKTVKGGVKRWRAIWLKKVLFKEPSEDLATKGEKPEYKTPTLEGTVMLACDELWKNEGTFSTEAGAVAWLNAKAGISSAVSTGLTGLVITNGTLTPSFSAAKFNYSCVATNSIFVNASAAGVIKLYVDGLYNQTLTTGVAGVAVAMSSGDNKLLEIVIQESGKKEIVTRIMVQRA
jgi:hypothetical protein